MEDNDKTAMKSIVANTTEEIERYSVSQCEKKRFTVEHFSEDTGTPGRQIKHTYISVRIGINWPTGTGTPYFFTTIGQAYDKTDGAGGLIQLTEYSTSKISNEDFFGKLTDYAEMYGVTEIFADIEQEKESFLDGFRLFLSQHNITNVSIIPAPFTNSHVYSVGLVKDQWRRGTLDLLRNGEALNQLRLITTSDLNEKTLETKFFAVNALRFTIAAFKKFPPLEPSNTYFGHDYQNIDSPNSWMVG